MHQVSAPHFAASPQAPAFVRDTQVVALGAGTTEAGELVVGPGIEGIDVDLMAIAHDAQFLGAAGEVLRVPTPGGIAPNPALRSILLIGVGRGSIDELRRAGAEVARATRNHESVATTIHLARRDGDSERSALRAVVAGLVLGSFSYHLKSGGAPFQPVGKVVLAAGEVDLAELDKAVALATASWQAREWASVPSNIKNPAWFADKASKVAADHSLTIKVRDHEALAKGGFGGLLAVGQASATPPVLVEVTYEPRRRSKKHVVLVGKGITYDTGGLSIKPTASMVSMKRDMTGAAVVLAAMAQLARMECPVKVTGLLCLAENAISGSAMRPGDVITHYGGRTTEVTNTDAEGRLVLADGLAYAVDRLKPTTLVDVATLTGAVKVALGQDLGGLFANEDDLASDLLAAGTSVGEPLWRMPLSSLYEDRLASKVADADNAPGSAAAITAALFLQHFVGGVPWAHLDVASVGDAPRDVGEWTLGPTGFGARLLLEWLEG